MGDKKTAGQEHGQGDHVKGKAFHGQAGRDDRRGTPDPVTQAELEQQMLKVCLARARAGGKPRHWQIFEANALQGMDGATVANRFHTTAANVWVIRHRLIGRLRTEWQALLNEPFRP